MQRPHPPVLLGGAAAPALRRAGRLAQGWISSSRHDLTRIGTAIETVRDGAREAGRDPEAVRILVRGVVDLVDDDPGSQRRPLQGTREQVLDDLAALRAQGVTEVFLDLNFSPRVGSPDVDAGAALAYAERVLDAFAPANASSRPALRGLDLRHDLLLETLQVVERLGTGTSANGGHRRGIVSPASLYRLSMSVICPAVPTRMLDALPLSV